MRIGAIFRPVPFSSGAVTVTRFPAKDPETMTVRPYLSRLPDPEVHPEFYRGVPLNRGLAWVIDMILIALACAVLLPFTLFLGLFFFPLMMLVVGFLYRWTTLARGSATWGMRFFGIELREADGSPLSPGTAFAHTLAYTVALAVAPLQLISAVMMVATPRGQGLGDMLLGTTALNRAL